MMEESEPPLRSISASSEARRLRLRVAAKLMAGAGFVAVLYVVLAAVFSGSNEVRSVPSQRVDIASLKPGEVRFLTWSGRPVLVYHRTPEDISQLQTADRRLADPQSLKSEQPNSLQNDLRSLTPQYFIALALGTGQGCRLDHLPADAEDFQGKPWAGGFVDSCGSDRYDLAGRVYRGQYASQNLLVPAHRIDGDVLILGQ